MRVARVEEGPGEGKEFQAGSTRAWGTCLRRQRREWCIPSSPGREASAVGGQRGRQGRVKLEKGAGARPCHVVWALGEILILMWEHEICHQVLFLFCFLRALLLKVEKELKWDCGRWGDYTDRTFKVIVAWIVCSDSRDEEKAAVFQRFLNFRVL